MKKDKIEKLSSKTLFKVILFLNFNKRAMTVSTYLQKLIKSIQKHTDDGHKEMIEKLTNELELDEEQEAKVREIVNAIFSSQEGGKPLVKKKRSPTAYNIFMKSSITNLKQQYPQMDKTDLMRKSAQLWQIQKQQNQA